jgi:hypothetical protein
MTNSPDIQGLRKGWHRRQNYRGARFHVFGDNWSAVVREDPFSRNRPYEVQLFSKHYCSYATLPEAKACVLQLLIKNA